MWYDWRDVLVWAFWLGVGLILGYVIGVAKTSLKYMRLMRTEVHECHEALLPGDHKEGT